LQIACLDCIQPIDKLSGIESVVGFVKRRRLVAELSLAIENFANRNQVLVVSFHNQNPLKFDVAKLECPKLIADEFLAVANSDSRSASGLQIDKLTWRIDHMMRGARINNENECRAVGTVVFNIESLQSEVIGSLSHSACLFKNALQMTQATPLSLQKPTSCLTDYFHLHRSVHVLFYSLPYADWIESMEYALIGVLEAHNLSHIGTVWHRMLWEKERRIPS